MPGTARIGPKMSAEMRSKKDGIRMKDPKHESEPALFADGSLNQIWNQDRTRLKKMANFGPIFERQRFELELHFE